MLIIALASLSTGCGERRIDSLPDSPETADAAHDKSHDHDHFTPAHKPAHFPAAVKTLQRLARDVGEELREGHREHAHEALVKLCDVLTWLPEIAADSEMPEKEWNDVKARASEMLAICRRLGPEMSEAQAGAVEREIEQTCADWQALVSHRSEWFPEAFPVEKKHD